MKRQGFTLIELLGVVTILGVLALIVFPIVLNQINKAKKEIENANNQLIIESAKDYVADNKEDYKKIQGISYCIDLKTLIDENYLNINLKDSNLNNIDKTQKIKLTYNNDFDYEVTKECTSGFKFYEDGTPVYFDVKNGNKCTNYKGVNSITGYNGIDSSNSEQNSCLKFYAFLDSTNSATVKLLLDHNTTAVVAWNSSENNSLGPSAATGYLLATLKSNTEKWNGVETPTNYEAILENGDTLYTIDYSSYMARLISAEEISEITRQNVWTTNGDNINLSDYDWLLDRISNSCKNSGSRCSNNAEGTNTYGYWTSSPYTGSSSYAWNVYDNDKLCYETSLTNKSRGLRPVITVSKYKLS